MDAVDDIKVNLMSMEDMHKEFVNWLDKGNFENRRSAKDIKDYNKLQVMHSRIINRANAQTDSGIRPGKFHGVSNDLKRDSRSYKEIVNNLKMNQNQEQKMDLEDMWNKLLNINMSMKSFSHNLEEKFHNAFKSSAGKIYGMKQSQIDKYNKKSTFKHDDYNGTIFDAQNYLKNINKL